MTGISQVNVNSKSLLVPGSTVVDRQTAVPISLPFPVGELLSEKKFHYC
jgi:hypothetical protein